MKRTGTDAEAKGRRLISDKRYANKKSHQSRPIDRRKGAWKRKKKESEGTET